MHAPLPKEQWTKPEEVRASRPITRGVTYSPRSFTNSAVPIFAPRLPSPQICLCHSCMTLTPLQDTQYLRPHIDSVVEENKERQYWDNLKVERK